MTLHRVLPVNNILDNLRVVETARVTYKRNAQNRQARAEIKPLRSDTLPTVRPQIRIASCTINLTKTQGLVEASVVADILQTIVNAYNRNSKVTHITNLEKLIGELK